MSLPLEPVPESAHPFGPPPPNQLLATKYRSLDSERRKEDDVPIGSHTSLMVNFKDSTKETIQNQHP
jgi:hypothetical protein